MTTTPDSKIMDCACVIHSTGYDWIYVDRLYDMLRKNSRREIRLHVYTEPDRLVPDHMIKHPLEEWHGVGGPKKSWWYKMQLFDSQHHQGPLLYFDLDVVITGNIDWMCDLDPKYFWAIDDFRRIFRPGRRDINSSVMYWDTKQYSWVWEEFKKKNLSLIMKRYSGDQDFLNDQIGAESRRFFDINKIKSYRWEIKDGGLDPRTRTHREPGKGSCLDRDTSVVVFHGQPKPHNIDDSVLQGFWNPSKVDQKILDLYNADMLGNNLWRKNNTQK